MSKYFKNLDPIAQARYVDKLKLLGLDKSGDPYEEKNSSNFVDDMTNRPGVEYGHIFCYYIDRPGKKNSLPVSWRSKLSERSHTDR